MTKHYVCRNVTELPAYMQANIKVGATSLYAGNIVKAEDLDTGIDGNLTVYTPTAIADITKDSFALVLNGNFEQLGNRRPEGNPDYTTYVFSDGDIASVIRLTPNARFEISVDACDDTVGAATIVPGDNLIPANDSNKLVYSAKATAVTAKQYLTIEAVKYFRIGGKSGTEFAKTLVCRAKSL